MSRRIELDGRRYGRLTVVRRCAHDSRYWECRCDCGAVVQINRGSLQTGDSRSCGCLHAEIMRARNTTHGLRSRPEYGVWAGMKKRCSNPKFQQFKDYGGRGIRVCDRWLNDFPAFLSDMGARPTDAHTIERRDNDGPYSAENCYWMSKTEQSKNRRSNHHLTWNGETRTLAEWARRRGFTHRSIILKRLRRGWSVTDALTIAPQTSRVWR